MFNPKLSRSAERLRLAHMLVGMSKMVHASFFGSDGNFGADVDAIFIACAVQIGHSEKRPMSATKIAHYLGIPRTTVLRKLDTLIQLNIVERVRHVYFITAERMATDDHIIDGLNKIAKS